MAKKAISGTDAHLNNRGLLFGDGFFTTGLIIDGAIAAAEMHWHRLVNAAAKLQFVDLNITQLAKTVEGEINGVSRAGFRLTIYRTQTQRGYAISSLQDFEVFIQLFDEPSKSSRHCQLFFAQTPASCNSMLAGVKHLNRLENVLAASEISATNEERILCDGERVIGGSRTNVFAYYQGQWNTPLISDSGINGITRQRLLKHLNELGVRCTESDITREQLVNASAICVTNSLIGVWPAASIENKALDIELGLHLKSFLSDD